MIHQIALLRKMRLQKAQDELFYILLTKKFSAQDSLWNKAGMRRSMHNLTSNLMDLRETHFKIITISILILLKMSMKTQCLKVEIKVSLISEKMLLNRPSFLSTSTQPQVSYLS